MTCEEVHALVAHARTSNPRTLTLAECAAWARHQQTCASCQLTYPTPRDDDGHVRLSAEGLAMMMAVFNDPEARAVMEGA